MTTPANNDWATELSAMHRIREMFEAVPEEARGRVFFWLGNSLDLTPIPIVASPAEAQARLQGILGQISGQVSPFPLPPGFQGFGQ